MDWTPELAQRLEDWVAALLKRVGMAAPPVETTQVAQCLGVQVAWSNSQTERARKKRMGGQSLVVLAADRRVERWQWSLAHELGEIVMPQLAEDLRIEFSPELHPFRERLANEFARRLLVPQAMFRKALRRQQELPWLKSRFATASHELVATRWLDESAAVVVTVIDQRQMTRRTSNCGATPSELSTEERQVLQQLRKERGRAEVATDRMHVVGWAIDEPHWQREILRAVPVEEC